MKKLELVNVSVRVHESFSLSNISASFSEGELVVLTGQSGSGKTVLLKTICGIFGYTGTIAKNNINSVAFQFQEGGLFDTLTVADNLAFQKFKGKKFLKELPEAEKQVEFLRIWDIASFLNISEAIFKKPYELSGGMKKRAVLGRALMEKVDLLILDDPTAGLDPINSRIAKEKILAIISKFSPITLLATHALRVFLPLASKILFLQNGRLVFQGTYSEFLKADLIPESFKLRAA